MADEFRFHGRERVTIELDGWATPTALAIPARLELDLDADRARVRLFAFHVDSLRITGVPLLRSSYAEVLWRIAVRDRGELGWWVAACDLGARGPRWAAARYVRYPVRALAVEVDADRISCGGAAGRLAIRLDPAGSSKVDVEARALLVGPEAEWRVPWGDDREPAHAAVAHVEIDSLSVATLGAPIAWASSAIVRHGRTHRCGVAQPRELSR